MKNKLTPLLLLLLLLLSLYSWIGSACGLDVRSLYSADGLRWMFSHFVPNVSGAPWGEILIGLITISIIWHSGIIYSVSRRASLKQKRALSLAILVLIVECVVIACLLLPPAMVLLNPFGTIAHSPFLRGLYGAMCVGIVIVCNVYGLSSGHFVTLADTIEAHVALLRQGLPLLLNVILVSQLVACLDYTHLVPSASVLYAWIETSLYVLIIAIGIAKRP